MGDRWDRVAAIALAACLATLVVITLALFGGLIYVALEAVL